MKDNDNDDRKIPFVNRVLIQLSNRSTNFTPFKTINK